MEPPENVGNYPWWQKGWPNGPTHVELQQQAAASGATIQPDRLASILATSRREWLQRCKEQLVSESDEMTRLVLVIAATTGAVPGGDSAIRPPVTDWDAVHELCPSFSIGDPTRSRVHAPWDHGPLQAWFLGHSVAPEDELHIIRRSWGRNKQRRVSGCRFKKGSTRMSTGNTPQAFDLVLLVPGPERLLCPGDSRLPSETTDCGFNARALSEMAVHARLRLLPRPSGSRSAAFLT